MILNSGVMELLEEFAKEELEGKPMAKRLKTASLALIKIASILIQSEEDAHLLDILMKTTLYAWITANGTDAESEEAFVKHVRELFELRRKGGLPKG